MIRRLLLYLFERPDVSPSWLRDTERRSWGVGIDQSVWRVWPWK